jgi:hypothetical protein
LSTNLNTGFGGTYAPLATVPGVPPAPTNYQQVTTVTPTGSPFTWQNQTPSNVLFTITGGSISALTKNGGTAMPSLTPVLLLPGDFVTVTYSGSPTMSYAVW